jgi:hypothetical protein
MATRQQRISDARSCAEMAQRMPPQGGLVCLPALYNSRLHVSSGGVIAYGVGLQTPIGMAAAAARGAVRTSRKSKHFQTGHSDPPRSGRGGRRFKSCHSDQIVESVA